MKITTEQLPQHLAQGLKPLYTVFGDETLLALEAGDRIRAAAREAGYTERVVLTVDSGFKWRDLALAGSAQSLFASRKLLDLRIPTGKPGTEGSAALQTYCQALPPETVTLVLLPELDWRAQKAGWFESLSQAGTLVEAKPVPRRALPQWIAGRLKAQDQDADADALDFMARRVEGNLMAAYQEVRKLALLYPAGRLTYEQVHDAVLDVARYDVFDLGVAMIEGDPLRLVRMLDGLKGEGAAQPLVLWAMCEEIRAIGKLIAGTAAGKPVSMLWREARIWAPAHQNLMQQNLARYTLAQVSEALRHAATIDRMIKGLAKGDAWDELLHLALRFARGGGGASGNRGRMTAARAAEASRSQQGLF
jgi:DNA polymerase III subunit delta